MINIAPLFINSIVAHILLIPFTITHVSDGLIPTCTSSFINCIHWLFTWIGISIGMHVIPSNKDMSNLKELAHSPLSRFFVGILTGFISLCNLKYIGFLLQLLFLQLFIMLTILLELFIIPAMF